MEVAIRNSLQFMSSRSQLHSVQIHPDSSVDAWAPCGACGKLSKKLCSHWGITPFIDCRSLYLLSLAGIRLRNIGCHVISLAAFSRCRRIFHSSWKSSLQRLASGSQSRALMMARLASADTLPGLMLLM